jgi:hypothetical protein
MTLGRTSSNAIKIKTDNGGLRAVNCACCEPCSTCAFSEGDIVTISALGKSSTVTIGGTLSCEGDIGAQRENQVFIPFRVRSIYSEGITGEICVPGAITSDVEDFFYSYIWTYSILGCVCRIDFTENTNISDVMINMGFDNCDSSGNFPPGCCVCNNTYETATVTKTGTVLFPITGYGTYNVTIPFTEFHWPYCAAYTVESNPEITVVLSRP